MTDQLEGQVSLFDPDMPFGKTYKEHSQAIKEQTSKKSSRSSSGSQSRKAPTCLCLRGGAGHTQGAYTMSWDVGALLGDYTTHSFGESPREENVSRLSQILEDSAPQKYFLSARACDGILRRAAKRKKELPPELKAALLVQSALKNEPENQGGARDY